MTVSGWRLGVRARLRPYRWSWRRAGAAAAARRWPQLCQASRPHRAAVPAVLAVLAMLAAARGAPPLPCRLKVQAAATLQARRFAHQPSASRPACRLAVAAAPLGLQRAV